MKYSQALLSCILFLITSRSTLLKAQTISFQANLEGMQLVQVETAPPSGTFWSWQKFGTEPPYPYDPFPWLPVFAYGNTEHFVVDDSSINYETLKEDLAARRELLRMQRAAAMMSLALPESLLSGGLSGGMQLMEEELPPVPGEGGGEETPVPTEPAYGYGTNTLWLEIIAATNGYANLIVHGTVPDMVYEILSRVALTNIPWSSEGTILGAPEQDWTPTLVPVGTRTNTLYFWARSWLDSTRSGLPDWWQLQNFGQLGVDPYGDPDGDGWNNLQEYQNGTIPNLFNSPRAPQPFTALVANVALNDVQLSGASDFLVGKGD